MAFRTDYAQTAQFYYLFLLSFSFFFRFLQQLPVFLAGVQQFLVFRLHKTGSECDRLVIVSLLDHQLSRLEFRIAAQYDISTSACHVGGNGNSAQPPRLSDYLRFPLMLLGVQHIKVFDTALFKSISYQLGFFYGNGTYQNRLSLFMSLFHPVYDRLVLAVLRSINSILQVFSDNRFVGRYHNYIHIIDVSELAFFRLCCTCHSCQFLIHPEIILQRYGRQCPGLRADQHAFLRFDSLVKTIAVSSPEHETSRKLIYDDYLTIFYDIINISLHHVPCLQRLEHVMVDFHILRVSKVFHPKILFAFFHTFVGECYLFILFLNCKIIIFPEGPDEAVCSPVHISGLVAFSRYYQRRPGLIYEDRIHLVYNGIVQLALHHSFLIDHHIIAQIIETVLIIGPISDIRLISGSPVSFGNAMYHASYREPQECIEFAHPFHITLCQIIVDGDHVDALSFQRVEVGRQRRHEGLTFTCLHLGYPALMEHDTTYHLNVEMLHAQTSPCTFPAYGECLRQYIVQRLSVLLDALFEFRSLLTQLIVRKRLHFLFICHDFIGYLRNFLYFLFVEISKDLLYQSHCELFSFLTPLPL